GHIPYMNKFTRPPVGADLSCSPEKKDLYSNEKRKKRHRLNNWQLSSCKRNMKIFQMKLNNTSRSASLMPWAVLLERSKGLPSKCYKPNLMTLAASPWYH